MIIADIDATNRSIARLITRAESSEGEADLLFMADDPTNAETIRQLRIDADTLRKRAENKASIRLEKLKQTLAAFRTEALLPGMGNHVVLQRKA